MVLGHLGITLFPLLFNRDFNWDARLLLVGAILPDLLDKPIGHLLLPQNNGRMIGHTILFSATLVLIAFKFRKIAPLAFGTAFHQLLDGVYLDARGALWPLLGPFEHTDYQLGSWLEAYTDPWIIGEELAGAAIIIMVITIYGISGVKAMVLKGRPTVQ